jgi:glucose-6-phosphate 1-dehydrogenase
MTIFGACGDLTKRKLIPALYNLASDQLLPEGLAVVGVARFELNQEDFRSEISQEVTGSDKTPLTRRLQVGFVRQAWRLAQAVVLQWTLNKRPRQWYALGGPMRTELEKMQAGELYDPLDPDLVRARDLNATR